VSAKPAYQVPSMTEIAELPHNGFNVISTFSGCGGSSLGYKMAGYRVLAACEFIPAAQDTYRANFPNTPIIGDDIRDVTPERLMETAGIEPGQLDILDGVES
jgi:DNA (cytosine-5)-methyltransferase 1